MRRVLLITILPASVGLIIPTLHSVADRISSGESRIAQRLNQEWTNNSTGGGIVWYTPTIGDNCLQPDFVVLDPNDGLVVLEVKEWKADTIVSCNPNQWTLRVGGRKINKKNPLQQAREYAEAICSLLESDEDLVHPSEHPYAGRLCVPYGYGVIFTNLSRKRNPEILDTMNGKHIICLKDENGPLLPWRNCLRYKFGKPLRPGQVDRVRGKLFPELVINQPNQQQETRQTEKTRDSKECNDRLFRVMDARQELLARSLGSGHRVIHGVSGSGKTKILLCRVKYLANQTRDPILVLCYNKVLANKLQTDLVRLRAYRSNVEVVHFHQWCRKMLLKYNLPLPDSTKSRGEFAEDLVNQVKAAVARRIIPVGAYHSILVDEVHDFAPEWIELLVQQVSCNTRSLLLVYDDAQKLYSHHRSNFSFRSVGVNARGRTHVLQINYRNTQQIIEFAYNFVQPFLQSSNTTVMIPRSAGRQGAWPIFFDGDSSKKQDEFMINQCLHLFQNGYRLQDIVVLCRTKRIRQRVCSAFQQAGLTYGDISCHSRKGINEPSLNIITMHSSKGLEFPVVFIPSIECFPAPIPKLHEEARLLYVAMTRATDMLYMLKDRSRHSPISDQLTKYFNI